MNTYKAYVHIVSHITMVVCRDAFMDSILAMLDERLQGLPRAAPNFDQQHLLRTSELLSKVACPGRKGRELGGGAMRTTVIETAGASAVQRRAHTAGTQTAPMKVEVSS